MKKGIILYVTQGRDDVPLKTAEDLAATARSFGAADVFVAHSEGDAAYGWMSLITRGMHQVFFMTVGYDAVLDTFESLSAPVRLCG